MVEMPQRWCGVFVLKPGHLLMSYNKKVLFDMSSIRNQYNYVMLWYDIANAMATNEMCTS